MILLRFPKNCLVSTGDPLFLEDQLSSEERMIRDAARGFAAAEFCLGAARGYGLEHKQFARPLASGGNGLSEEY